MNDPKTDSQRASAPSQIASWFTQRPKWLQIAAKRLLESGDLDDSDISELAELCKQEVKSEFPDLDYCISPDFFDARGSEKIHLCSVSEISGVNRLAPQKPLDFGESNIAVIYGGNGSGKSGYVRLLKHICGARSGIRGQLYGNVFSNEKVAQKAVISFLKDGSQEKYKWMGSGVCEALGSVEIFDTSFGQVFKGDEGEVSYEPLVLIFFSRLIDVCDRVAIKLDTDLGKLVSEMPRVPVDFSDSAEITWVRGLSVNTSLDEVENHCSFTGEEQIRLKDLQERISEESPADKAAQLRTKKVHADNLVKELQTCLNELSAEKCKKITAAKQALALKISAAKVAAEDLFSDAILNGIGSSVWKELWGAARRYSEERAYVGQEFPHVQNGAVCVLCHQSLSEEAKRRFISFESFIKGETQKQVDSATKDVQHLVDALPKIPSLETLEIKIAAAGIKDQTIIGDLKNSVSALRDRKSMVESLDQVGGFDGLNQSSKWIKVIRLISQGYENDAKGYEEDAKNDNRSDLIREMKDLQAKKWLSQHKQAIQAEINLLGERDHFRRAKEETNTRVLSVKKGALSEEIITEALVQRFNDELKNLHASGLAVELVKSKTSKGRVIHNIQLDGANYDPNEILSEGEKRIVSIAAFLADVTGRAHPASLVFDDPMSSLDQDYEEAVVERLCNLASERQVVIFTHRLPLLGLIQKYALKVGIRPRIICVRSETWGTGEPGDPLVNELRPDCALNYLINKRLPKARRVLSESGSEYYQIYAKSLCSDFRNLVERMIEWRLLSGVIQRHRREIRTGGKIKRLAEISAADCNYLDALMTKYSRYEHSQSLEAPVVLPGPDELESDFKRLRQWQSDFKTRVNTRK